MRLPVPPGGGPVTARAEARPCPVCGAPPPPHGDRTPDAPCDRCHTGPHDDLAVLAWLQRTRTDRLRAAGA
ncbi:hypothetical protein [Streptomyces sp. NPDC050856]|uniref:hypothetical protein n=1 Tax=Streptomyces sp. NPDC050856 TaxID=3154939 RepID=UPI0033E9D21C